MTKEILSSNTYTYTPHLKILRPSTAFLPTGFPFTQNIQKRYMNSP